MSYFDFTGNLACMENVLEDVDVDVSVEVGEPAEEIEEQVETVEAASEVQEEVAEAEQTSDAVEMIFRTMSMLENRADYLKTYGYDRRFAMLSQTDGVRYAQSFALESVSEVASSNDSNTIAALEGIGDALKSAWDWIKKVLAKMAAWFGKIFRAIGVMFSSTEANIARLRKEYKNRTWDAEKADKAKGDIPDPANVAKLDKEVSTYAGAVEVLFKGAQQQAVTAINSNTFASITDDMKNNSAIMGSTIGADGTADKDSADKVKEIIKKIDDLISDVKKTTSISNPTPKMIDDFLSNGAKLCGQKNRLAALNKVANQAIDQANKVVKQSDRMNDAQNSYASNQLKKVVRVLSANQRAYAKIMQALKAGANVCVSGAAKLISSCTKKS